MLNYSINSTKKLVISLRFRQLSNMCRSQIINRSLRLNIKCFKYTNRYYSYEGDGKTVAIMLNKEPGVNLMINSYSNYGFRLNNGLFVLGPLAIFPKSILQWNVESVNDINENSLSLFYLLEPKIDVLVLGVGDAGNIVKPSVIKYLQNKKINVEMLPTQHACTTYNYLTLENRCVAAALIPPTVITFSDEDIINTQNRRKILYQQDF